MVCSVNARSMPAVEIMNRGLRPTRSQTKPLIIAHKNDQRFRNALISSCSKVFVTKISSPVSICLDNSAFGYHVLPIVLKTWFR